MSKTSTFNAGMRYAQTNKSLPKMTGVSNTTAQTFKAGYAFGKR